MRSATRFERAAGNRSTGTLTRPNVSVPLQNARGSGRAALARSSPPARCSAASPRRSLAAVLRAVDFFVVVFFAEVFADAFERGERLRDAAPSDPLPRAVFFLRLAMSGRRAAPGGALAAAGLLTAGREARLEARRQVVRALRRLALLEAYRLAARLRLDELEHALAVLVVIRGGVEAVLERRDELLGERDLARVRRAVRRCPHGAQRHDFLGRAQRVEQ